MAQTSGATPGTPQGKCDTCPPHVHFPLSHMSLVTFPLWCLWAQLPSVFIHLHIMFHVFLVLLLTGASYVECCEIEFVIGDSLVILPDSEERSAIFAEKQLQDETEERLAREHMYQEASALSKRSIENGLRLVYEAIENGRNTMPYPLPIATSAIPALRESLPDDYHIFVENWESLDAVIRRHVVTPNYELYESHCAYYDDEDEGYGCVRTSSSRAYMDMVDKICKAIPCKYRPHMDDPVVFFTIYWDYNETDFLRRRMDTWTRFEDRSKRCTHYNLCMKYVPSYGYFGNYLGGHWERDYDEDSLPPHPRDV